MSEVILDDFDDESPVARDAWVRLAESAFSRDWDNELDAIYDNWRELYNVPESTEIEGP